MKTIFLSIVLCLSSILIFAQNTIKLTEIQSGFRAPVDITHAGDDRLFIVEQNGRIQIIQADGSLNESSFLNISNKIRFGGEGGLLGVAFHPDYATNGLFYVNYTATNGDTHISSFKVSDDPNFANASTEKILIKIEQPYNNHNGGCLKFGPDGYLYIGLGDGGSRLDPQNNSQNDAVFLGKMLRIAVNDSDTYQIPPDNPFKNNPNIPDEIWATGLRNPWRFSFDRMTKDLWIGDVGQDSFEEINKVNSDEKSGLDFGWRCWEGQNVLNNNDCADKSTFHFPIHTYPTLFSVGESVTGGFVYRGVENPALIGKYIYGDYKSGRIWALSENSNGDLNNEKVYKMGIDEISTFGENAVGELFVAAYTSGKIYKINQGIISTTNNIQKIEKITVSPNPFSEFLQINIPTKEPLNLNLQILDLTGRVLFESHRKVNGEFRERIDLNNLLSGVYYLKISNIEGAIIEKIIKL